MMTWNYRLVRKVAPECEGGVWYDLHEVFYDDNGSPHGMTEKPIDFGGETQEEVIQALEMALKDARAHGPFDPPAKWLGKGRR